jgi:hypothetical protein
MLDVPTMSRQSSSPGSFYHVHTLYRAPASLNANRGLFLTYPALDLYIASVGCGRSEGFCCMDVDVKHWVVDPARKKKYGFSLNFFLCKEIGDSNLCPHPEYGFFPSLSLSLSLLPFFYFYFYFNFFIIKNKNQFAHQHHIQAVVPTCYFIPC